MMRYFKTRKSQVTLIQETFFKYMDSCREFWKIAERRTTELSRDRKGAWQNMFRLQRLFIDRQALRFECLLGRGIFASGSWGSLDSICQRLDKEWTEMEEVSLTDGSSIYADVSREIKDLQSRLDSAAARGPGQILKQDSQYNDARLAMAARVKKLDKKLSM